MTHQSHRENVSCSGYFNSQEIFMPVEDNKSFTIKVRIKEGSIG